MVIVVVLSILVVKSPVRGDLPLELSVLVQLLLKGAKSFVSFLKRNNSFFWLLFFTKKSN